jgi:hypothetical protein
VLVAVLEADGVVVLLDLVEDRPQGLDESGCSAGRPDDEGATGLEPVADCAQEALVVDRGVVGVDELVGAVVDVEQHHVVRRRTGLGERADDVRDDHPCPAVGQELAAVRDGPVTHPLDEGRLDLDHVDVLDPSVAEHPVEGEPEAQPTHQHPAWLGHRVEGRVGQGMLGGMLGGVHDEDAVGPELQHGRATAVGPAFAEHQLAALGLTASHLDVLHVTTLVREQDGPVEEAEMVDEANVRDWARRLPEVEEKVHARFGVPRFTVRGRTFLGIGRDRTTVVLCLTEDEAEAAMADDPGSRRTVRRQDARRSFLGLEVDLASMDGSECERLVEQAWRAQAPRRLVASYDAGRAGSS